MKKIEFKINIAAPKQKVWDTMLAHGTYEEWCSAGWPGSTYTGNWNQDSTYVLFPQVAKEHWHI